MIQTRAKKGGQIGKNGEFYAGGTFLPTTQLSKMTRPTVQRGSGKQQIEPYKWEVAPEGKKSLFSQINGVIGTCTATTAKIRTDAAFESTLAYYEITMAQAINMIDLYNSGERWM